jgi:hypothetical protein
MNIIIDIASYRPAGMFFGVRIAGLVIRGSAV